MLIDLKSAIVRHNLHPKNVIHIGAHHGQEAKCYYELGIEHSLWIEANSDIMDILVNNLAYFPDAQAINACLSDEDGKNIDFFISNNEQSSSILDLEYHKIAHKEVEYIRTEKVITQTLNALLERNNISYDKYDFLNADIQGAELMMLKGATKVLPHLNFLYLEVNEKELYKGCALIPELDSFLKKYGFNRVETQMCGDLGWGDAIYIKN